MYPRTQYLKKIISKKDNGRIKIISKLVVVRDYLKPRQDENGTTYVAIEQFLLNEDFLR